MPFDPSTAVPENDTQGQFDPSSAVLEATPSLVSKEDHEAGQRFFDAKTPGERLRILADHWSYSKSIEKSFEAPRGIPQIPQIPEGTSIPTGIPGVNLPDEAAQTATAVVNTATSLVNSATSSGAVSMMLNPGAALYAAPKFAMDAWASAKKTFSDFAGAIHGQGQTSSTLAKDVLSTALNALGTAGGVHGIKDVGGRVNDLVSPKRETTPMPTETGDTPVPTEPVTPETVAAPAFDPTTAVPETPVKYTVVQDFTHPATGKKGGGYVQIDRIENDGRGEPMTEAERAAYPKPPDWLPTGTYSLDEIQTAIDRSTATDVAPTSEPTPAPVTETPIAGPPSEQTPVPDLAKETKRISDKYGISLVVDPVEGHPDQISISSIQVPKGSEGQGTGTKAIQELNAYADQKGLKISLTASTSAELQPKLESFYKKNGYVKYGEDPLSGKPFYGRAPKVVEEPTSGGFTTSLKNAQVDSERVARGQEPLMSAASKDFPAVWDEATKRLDQNPNAGSDLVKDLSDKPRPISDTENALLLRERIIKRTDFDRAARGVDEAVKMGDPQSLVEARSDFNKASDALHAIDVVGRTVGTEQGRGLNARKMMADEEFSLASMTLAKRAANDGRPLTPEQQSVVESAQKQIAELRQAVEDYHQQALQIANEAQEPAPRDSPPGKIRQFITDRAKEARARIQARLQEGRQQSGLDPTDLADHAIVGAEYIAKGITELAEWSAEMLKEFGERIRPHLQEIFDKAKSESLDAKRLAAMKTRTQKSIDVISAKTAAGDFTKAERPSPLRLDKQAVELQTKLEAAKQKFHEGLLRDQLKNRTPLEKIRDATVKWARAAKLSSPTVFPKLIEAGLIRVITNPLNRILGQPLRAIPGLAEKAPYELGTSLKAEADSIAAVLSSAPKVWAKLTKGKSNIDVLGKKSDMMNEMVNVVGNAHGAIKEPVRQGAYARSMQLRVEAAARAGLDIRDPAVQTSIISAAVEDANREIFMNDNIVSKYLFRLPIRALENSDIAGTTALARTLEFLIPIVTVPTNIAIHTTRLNPLIGFGEAATRIVMAAKKGELANKAAKLAPEDARAIAIAFKAGAAGTILAAYAWTHPDNFGGTFGQPVQNKKLKSGQIQILGTVIPSWMNHAPELNTLNLVASARRAYDRYYKKSPTNATIEALAFTTMAPVKSLPFIDTFLRIYEDHGTLGRASGALVRDAVIPGAFTSTLRLMDDKTRHPKTFADEIKMGLPGLRSDVKGTPIRNSP